MSFHTVILVGRLGKDPEQKQLNNGQTLCTFSMACNQNGKDKTPIWFKVTAWGKLAETCQLYLLKGKMVLVEGTLVADESGGPRIWTRQDQTPAASFEINANIVRFLSQKQETLNKDESFDNNLGF